MSDNSKQQRYLEISRQITEQVGGKENIVASTHCATRLRIVLKDYDKINKEAIDNIDLVKGEFVAGNQLQIIFGAGLVNEIYEVFSQYTGKNFTEYLRKLRLDKAKKLLQGSDMKIREICQEVGLDDVSRFTRLFKEETGKTPNAYRKEPKD